MPISVTYPGVYIEEIPSGVQTITGVATSIAAFVGWAPQGPVGSAVMVLSWPDFTRQFGGLDTRSYLGYAVYQFFLNGGTQAYIIRIVGTGNAAAAVTLSTVLTLTAQSPGLWGTSYGVTVTNLATAGRFRLQVFNLPPSPAPAVLVESFENLSMSSSDSRYVQNIVNNQSNFITATVIGTNPSPPANNATAAPLTGGLDGTVLAPASMTASSAGAFETAVLPGSGVGVDLLEHVDLFNILCVPGEADPGTLQTLEAFCQSHRAMLIADCYQDATFSSLSGSGPNSALHAARQPSGQCGLLLSLDYRTGSSAQQSSEYVSALRFRRRHLGTDGWHARSVEGSGGHGSQPDGVDRRVGAAQRPRERRSQSVCGELHP